LKFRRITANTNDFGFLSAHPAHRWPVTEPVAGHLPFLARCSDVGVTDISATKRSDIDVMDSDA